MSAPRYAIVMITSLMPWSRSNRRMCSITGVPATGTSGLGWRLVSGRSREPSPPAMTTAFTVILPYRAVVAPVESYAGGPAFEAVWSTGDADADGAILQPSRHGVHVEAAGGKARHHARRDSLRRKEVIAVEVELHAHGQERGGSRRDGEDAARYENASQRRSALI